MVHNSAQRILQELCEHVVNVRRDVCNSGVVCLADNLDGWRCKCGVGWVHMPKMSKGKGSEGGSMLCTGKCDAGSRSRRDQSASLCSRTQGRCSSPAAEYTGTANKALAQFTSCHTSWGIHLPVPVYLRQRLVASAAALCATSSGLQACWMMPQKPGIRSRAVMCCSMRKRSPIRDV